MKILYVYTTASIVPGSVQQKVMNQILSLKKNGVDCTGLFLTTDEFEKAEEENFQFIKVKKIQAKWFRSSKQKKEYQKTLLNCFEKEQPEYDLIYCRYPGAGKHIASWLKLTKGKVFFEHVTAEVPEIKLYARENPFILSLSSVLSYFEFYFLPIFNEWLYGRKIRRSAAFGISNSLSIKQYEDRIAAKEYVRYISGDAVKVCDFELKENSEQPFRMNLLFLKGAVTAGDFNGLDRLFRGMAVYKGQWQIHLYLFGKNLEKEKRTVKELGIEDLLSFGNFISREDLNKLMPQIDLGISAMGVHRKGLKSTTTIKTREYFARGLPFIFGHSDPDFSEKKELRNYCLELSANDEPVDMDAVIAWYEKLPDKKVLAAEMRNYALKHLDYDVKMGKLADFLRLEQSVFK